MYNIYQTQNNLTMNDVLDVINYFDFFLIQENYVVNANYIFVVVVLRIIKKTNDGYAKYVCN